jgi:hypothetical protein
VKQKLIHPTFASRKNPSLSTTHFDLNLLNQDVLPTSTKTLNVSMPFWSSKKNKAPVKEPERLVITITTTIEVTYEQRADNNPTSTEELPQFDSFLFEQTQVRRPKHGSSASLITAEHQAPQKIDRGLQVSYSKPLRKAASAPGSLREQLKPSSLEGKAKYAINRATHKLSSQRSFPPSFDQTK